MTEHIESLSNIDALSGIGRDTQHKGAKSNEALREACREFEGLLASVILKESLKPGVFDDEGPGGNSALHEFAIEQVSRSIGQSEALGISKMLYQQIIQNLE